MSIMILVRSGFRRKLKAREKIKRGECWCPLANVAYTNMLMNTKSLAKVGVNYISKH